ncbi:sigma factor [uncultured Nocardioides sp.]|uniref:RNA polymerase sigma factor n=1 Tax=uncultured Nocardioides sp. TaxID=198441 RepID=UPI00260E48AD|nr:sigma factor [uncultured Nocardioides sp.]
MELPRGRRRRDSAAFAEFVQARSRALHRAAYLLVGRRGLAEDLVQETLVKTYVGQLTEPFRPPMRLSGVIGGRKGSTWG